MPSMIVRDNSGRFPAVVHIARDCFHCGKSMLLAPWQAKRRAGGNKFCSKKCCYEGRELKATFQKGHPDLVPIEARKLVGRKNAKSRLGMKFSPEHCKNLGAAKRGIKLTQEHIRKSLSRRPMSSLEIKFSEIITKNNLPFKFVGNGAFFVERKNPDFIHSDGKKIALEVYYRRHKEQFAGGLESWMKNRRDVFLRHGWEIVFFDESAVNEESALIRLGGSHS